MVKHRMTASTHSTLRVQPAMIVAKKSQHRNCPYGVSETTIYSMTTFTHEILYETLFYKLFCEMKLNKHKELRFQNYLKMNVNLTLIHLHAMDRTKLHFFSKVCQWEVTYQSQSCWQAQFSSRGLSDQDFLPTPETSSRCPGGEACPRRKFRWRTGRTAASLFGENL